ncbi:hypothetical protein D9613_009137 [Agrocybe pediades]|uniref:Peptidase C14 caspase domain-containing protein n=1 Tax=Agrocybe pediades TaxID=84607 RepID=A0A8H4R2J6_9AGAR|nr:hypothetical protein D9613_009137 [Agrocybe pediades]
MSTAISANLVRPMSTFSIAVNHYSDLPDLASSVADGDRFDTYVQTNLGVPRRNIVSLRDAAATKNGILNGFKRLLNHVKASGTAYVIIFFSGHGTWDGTTSSDSVLCPSDFGSSKVIGGISGSTISEWRHELAAAGVLKTTVILDCCGASGLVSLGIPESIKFSPKPSSRVVTHNTRRALRYLHRSSSGFTLFASSGRSKDSYENPEEGGSLFVNSFLSVLQEANFKSFTDISLMHRLPSEPEFRQMPHCISNGRIYGTLFIGRGDEGGTSFVVTAMEEGQCTIVRAGSAEGIKAGSVWSIHRTNLADSQENPALGQLTVLKVDLFSTTVKIPPLPSAIPFTANSILYSKLVRNADSSEPISVYSFNKAWLESVIPPAVRTELSVRIVDNIEESDLALWVDQGRVRFQRRKKLQIPYSEPVMRGSVNAENVSAIRNVVKASIFFDYHLKRNSQREFKGVRMELKEVDEEELEEGNLCPKENVLSDEWSATIHDCEQKRFIVTLHNESDIPLYPYLFYFDPDKLTITSLYSPPVGGGKDGFTSLVDAPLAPKKQLNIGNINADDGLLAFDVAKGENAEVGYLRLFLSTQPAAFDTMVSSESPFFPMVLAKGLAQAPRRRPSKWMVKTATLNLIR